MFILRMYVGTRNYTVVVLHLPVLKTLWNTSNLRVSSDADAASPSGYSSQVAVNQRAVLNTSLAEWWCTWWQSGQHVAGWQSPLNGSPVLANIWYAHARLIVAHGHLAYMPVQFCNLFRLTVFVFFLRREQSPFNWLLQLISYKRRPATLLYCLWLRVEFSKKKSYRMTVTVCVPIYYQLDWVVLVCW